MDHIKRPKMTVLPEAALIPERNLIQPPPKLFTHVVKAEQPYYYSGPDQKAPPEGYFPAGTKVVVLSHDSGPFCHVADGRGLVVTTEFDGLEPI